MNKPIWSRPRLSLLEAILAAEEDCGGKAMSAEFEFHGSAPAHFEVEVLSAGGRKLTRYDLDPRTAQVRATHDEGLEKLVPPITPEELRQSPTTLTHAIALAQAKSGGHACSAGVGRRGGGEIEYRIETVDFDGTSHKVRVSATDGTVREENP